MNQKYKILLFLITILIDLFVIGLWYFKNDDFTFWDKFFSVFIFCSHIPFYIALLTENRLLLDFLHFMMFLCMLFVFVIENIGLIFLSLLFVLGLQIQWNLFNVCILNSEQQNIDRNFGYSKITSISALFYTCYVCFKLGYLSSINIQKN